MGTLQWVQRWFGLGGGSGRAEPADGFSYSPHLIASLEGDHSELLRQYGAIEKMAVAGHFARIPAALSAFKAKFDVHVLNENLHFYCYLERALAARPDDLALIRGFRSEMNAIARGVVNFVKKYRTVGVRPANGSEFLSELQVVGALLGQRVEREEKDLYVLYRP